MMSVCTGHALVRCLSYTETIYDIIHVNDLKKLYQKLSYHRKSPNGTKIEMMIRILMFRKTSNRSAKNMCLSVIWTSITISRLCNSDCDFSRL